MDTWYHGGLNFKRDNNLFPVLVILLLIQMQITFWYISDLSIAK